MKQVKPADLAAAIIEELESYQQDVTDGIKADCKAVGEECARDIQAHSPARTGNYRKGWKSAVAYERKNDIRVVVHNGKHYRLTHLLENGHQLAGGGRVAARPHIGPAAHRAEKMLLKKVRVTVKK